MFESFRGAHGPHVRRGLGLVLVPVLVPGMALVACRDDPAEGTGSSKGRLDRQAMEAGMEVTISGDVGTVEVPFLVAVPEVQAICHRDGDHDLAVELSTAVSLVVSSTHTGTTAELTLGSLVEGVPAAPSEWSWELDEDRELATMTFFTTTSGGLTLKPNLTYDAMLTIATNPYIDAEDAFAFSVLVVEDQGP